MDFFIFMDRQLIMSGIKEMGLYESNSSLISHGSKNRKVRSKSNGLTDSQAVLHLLLTARKNQFNTAI